MGRCNNFDKFQRIGCSFDTSKLRFCLFHNDIFVFFFHWLFVSFKKYVSTILFNISKLLSFDFKMASSKINVFVDCRSVLPTGRLAQRGEADNWRQTIL
jgi:hypothetical protein